MSRLPQEILYHTSKFTPIPSNVSKRLIEYSNSDKKKSIEEWCNNIGFHVSFNLPSDYAVIIYDEHINIVWNLVQEYNSTGKIIPLSLENAIISGFKDSKIICWYIKKYMKNFIPITSYHSLFATIAKYCDILVLIDLINYFGSEKMFRESLHIFVCEYLKRKDYYMIEEIYNNSDIIDSDYTDFKIQHVLIDGISKFLSETKKLDDKHIMILELLLTQLIDPELHSVVFCNLRHYKFYDASMNLYDRVSTISDYIVYDYENLSTYFPHFEGIYNPVISRLEDSDIEFFKLIKNNNVEIKITKDMHYVFTNPEFDFNPEFFMLFFSSTPDKDLVLLSILKNIHRGIRNRNTSYENAMNILITVKNSFSQVDFNKVLIKLLHDMKPFTYDSLDDKIYFEQCKKYLGYIFSCITFPNEYASNIKELKHKLYNESDYKQEWSLYL